MCLILGGEDHFGKPVFAYTFSKKVFGRECAKMCVRCRGLWERVRFPLEILF